VGAKRWLVGLVIIQFVLIQLVLIRLWFVAKFIVQFISQFISQCVSQFFLRFDVQLPGLVGSAWFPARISAHVAVPLFVEHAAGVAAAGGKPSIFDSAVLGLAVFDFDISVSGILIILSVIGHFV
jgi:hypothetical protein